MTDPSTLATFEWLALLLMALAPAIVAGALAWVNRRQHARMTALRAECESVKTLLEAVEQQAPATAAAESPGVDHHVDLLRSTFMELAETEDVRLDPGDSEELRLLALRHEMLQSELQMLRGELAPGDGQARIQAAIETLFGGTAAVLGAPWLDFRNGLREQLQTIMRGVATAPARERLLALEQRCAQLDELIGVAAEPWDAPVASDPALPSTEVRDLLEALHVSLDNPDDAYDHAGGRMAELKKTAVALDAAIERLEQAPPPAAESGAADPAAAEAEAQRQDEFKELIMQFTRDSRDMLNCIAELEVANERLRAKLEENGIAWEEDAPADDARSPAADAPTDAEPRTATEAA